MIPDAKKAAFNAHVNAGLPEIQILAWEDPLDRAEKPRCPKGPGSHAEGAGRPAWRAATFLLCIHPMGNADP